MIQATPRKPVVKPWSCGMFRLIIIVKIIADRSRDSRLEHSTKLTHVYFLANIVLQEFFH
jgi:hypothetical protein